MTSTAIKRNFALDALRALAISLVLMHHIGQAWPGVTVEVLGITHWGAQGVDLFFVLSGWLIGGLFWREKAEMGKVNLLHFWQRRWLRTIPPYLGGLFLAWLAVYLYRGEMFNWGYLLFLQNYYDQMPFFLVSWSLCVEEHFYLVVPLVFAISSLKVTFGLVLVLLPTLLRALEYPGDIDGWGYYSVASHLYADGLLLGFVLAGLHRSGKLPESNTLYMIMLLCSAAAIVALQNTSGYWHYVLQPVLFAVFFSALLLVSIRIKSANFAGSRLIEGVALTSYSIYLTHALVIHVYFHFIHGKVTEWFSFSLTFLLLLILMAGWCFYVVFEKSSLSVRQRIVPKRV